MKATTLILIPAILALISYGVMDQSNTVTSIETIPAHVIEAHSIWKMKQGRLYATPNENNYRLKTFYETYLRVEKYNSNPNRDNNLALNDFADMTFEEFATKYTGAKPEEGELAHEYENNLEALNVKQSVDWRNVSGVVSSVKNQSSCGSCWAFAAAVTLESEYNRMRVQQGKSGNVSVSAREFLDCSGGGTCNGGNSKNALAYSKTYNVNSWNRYGEYKPVNQQCLTAKQRKWGSRTKNVITVARNSHTALVKQAEKRVFTIYMQVDQNFKDLGRPNGTRGIITRCTGTVYWHAVSVVGYALNGGYYIVKNSWGTGWGENGYFRLRMSQNGQNGVCNHQQYGGYAVTYDRNEATRQ